MVCVDGEGAFMLLLLAYAEERADLILVVRARDPAVVHTEAESGRLGLCLDGIERCEQLGGVDAVAPGLCCDRTHGYSSRASLIGRVQPRRGRLASSSGKWPNLLRQGP
jgi:hypothetical protein